MKNNYDVSVTDNTLTSNTLAGTRARQLAFQQDRDRLYRDCLRPGKPIPIGQALVNLIVIVLVLCFLMAREKGHDRNPSYIPPAPHHFPTKAEADADIQAVRNGTYDKPGIPSEQVIREQRRLGLRD